MKDKVLITGGAGFIGSHTADLLIEKGYKVRIMDNLSSKTHYGDWPKYLHKDVEKLKGDVRYKKHWKKALKDVNYVIHLAAWMDLIPEFSKFFDINVTGTSNLYEVVVNENFQIKKIVVASSQAVYGQGRWICKKHGDFFPNERDEDRLQRGLWDPICSKCNRKVVPAQNLESHNNPNNHYSISKYSQELISINVGRLYDIPSTALRYSNVHGSRQSIKSMYAGVLKHFASMALRGENLIHYEDGQQLRDYVSVKDVARANVLVMETEESNYETYNVGGPEQITVVELAQKVNNLLGKDLGVKTIGQYRVGDIRHSLSDTSKLKKLGWEPKYNEEDNIRDYLDWLEDLDVESGKKYISELRKLGGARQVNN